MRDNEFNLSGSLCYLEPPRSEGSLVSLVYIRDRTDGPSSC